MAYFDNAATSYPKPEVVYAFMDSFYKNHGGSAGRGNYELADTAKGIIEETRREGRKCYYIITSEGEEILRREYDRLRQQITDYERMI